MKKAAVANRKQENLNNVTYPESNLISIGVDCLKISPSSIVGNNNLLMRRTKLALSRYKDAHLTEVALTSIIAYIISNHGHETDLINHVVTIIKEIENESYR